MTKKTSLLSALLFLAGVLVGGTSVFFFLRPAPAPSQVSEPVTAPPAVSPSGGAAEVPSEEEMPQGLEEAEEIPAEDGGERPHTAAPAEEHHEVDSD